MKRYFLSCSLFLATVGICAGQDLVAHYPFNNNANDESGNGNHGTVNGAILTTDRNGNENSAYAFDGSDFIDIPLAGLNTATGTVILWFQISGVDYGNQKVFFSISNNASETITSFYSSIDQRFGLSASRLLSLINIEDLGPTPWQLWVPESQFNSQTNFNWNNLAVVQDGVEAKMYLNGNLVGSFGVNNDVAAWWDDLFSAANPSTVATIGHIRRNGTTVDNIGFNGKIDDIRIYNRALTEQEVLDLYYGTLTLTSPNGGEQWMGLSTQDINWSSSNTSGNVCIESSLNNGADWDTVIASTPDDGSYSWTLPEGMSAECLIRISDADGEPEDVCDAVFTIQHSSNPVGENPFVQLDHWGRDQVYENYGIELRLNVSDPQGLGDIISVTAAAPGGAVYTLYDDGQHSDHSSGDGYFGNNIWNLTTPPPLGEYIFTVTDAEANTTTENRIINTLLDIPRNIQPVNHSVISSPVPTFSWDAVPDVELYDITVHDGSINLWTRDGITGTSIVYNDDATGQPLQEGKLYYFNIHAKCEGTNSWQDDMRFVYSTEADNPIAINPQVRSMHRGNDYGYHDYGLELYMNVTDPQGLSDIAAVTVTSPNSIEYTLYDDGQHADDGANDGRYGNHIWDFGQQAPPTGEYLFAVTDNEANITDTSDILNLVLDFPRNLHPGFNEILSTATPEFSWDPVDGVTSYAINIRGRNNNHMWSANTPNTSLTYNYDGSGAALEEGTMYYLDLSTEVDDARSWLDTRQFAFSSAHPLLHGVPQTTEAMTIDGNETESTWNAIPLTRLLKTVEGSVNDSADFYPTFKACWDATNLYLLFDITDDILSNSSGDAWQNDAIEIYFDMNNSRGTYNPGVDNFAVYDYVDDYQIRYEWGKDNRTGYPDISGITTAYFTNPASDGYTYEMSIPWSSLGIPVAAIGVNFGFDLNIIDRDAGDTRDAVVNWNSPATENWRSPNMNGTAELRNSTNEWPEEPAAFIVFNGYHRTDGSTVELNAGIYAGPYDIPVIIKNTGQAMLENISVSISGSGYSLLTTPASILASNESSSFTIRLDTNLTGTFSGILNISSNDPASPYDLNFTTSVIGIPDTLDIRYTEETIALDGVDNESIWQTVSPVAMTRIAEGPEIINPDDLSVTYKSCWDADNLYFFVDINDEVLSEMLGEPWYYDNIEFFFDMNNSRLVANPDGSGYAYDQDDRQIRFNYNSNTITGINVPEGIQFYQAVSPGNDGYTFEIAFPWSSLGVPASGVGMQFGFSTWVEDNDGGSVRENIISWYASILDAWRNPSLWGIGRLHDENGSLPFTPKAMLYYNQHYYPDGYTMGLGTSIESTTSQYTYQLKNIGQADLGNINVTVTGEGYTLAAAPSVTLSPQQQTDLSISFTPDHTGSFQGTVEVSSSDPTSPYIMQIQHEAITAPELEYETDANTVLLLHMNELSGPTVYDYSGFENNGSASGTTVGTGQYGSAREFYNAPDQIRVDDDTSLNFGNDSYTIEFWIKTPPNSGGHPLHKRGNTMMGTTGRGWFTNIGDNKVELSLYNDPALDGEAGHCSINSLREVADNTWHHVAFVNTYDTVRCYIDGILDNETEVAWPGSPDNDGTIEIGVGSHTGEFLGALDEIRISNIARTKSEFNIAPYMEITAPLPGEIWPTSTEKEITWNSFGTSGNVMIEFSRDNGLSWTTLAASIPDNGSYWWQIPGDQSTECLIRIGDTDGDPADTTDGAFSIFTLNRSIPVVIPKINATIALDGNPHKTLWDTIPQNPIALPLTGEANGFTGPADLSAYWKAYYNNSGLYILVDVTDDDFHYTSTDYGQFWEKDLVEIYLDMNADNLKDGQSPSSNPVSSGGNTNGHYQFSAFSETGQAMPPNYWSFQNNVRRQVILNPDNSYSFEMFIPWSDIPDRNNNIFNPGDTRPIGFDICVSDNDGPENGNARYRKVWANTATNGESWSNMDSCGLIMFLPVECDSTVRTLYVDINNNSGTEDGTITYPFNTIQEAINLEGCFDTIIVAPGTYLENIAVQNRNLFIASHFITSDDSTDIINTIIDGNGTGPGVYLCNTGTSLIGFTIQNGQASRMGGGGISISNGNPVIRNCIVQQNTGIAYSANGGGGIYCGGGSPQISHCIVRNNHSPEGAGGIRAGGGNISIVNCLVVNNTGSDGIHFNDETGSVVNSTITGNSGAGFGLNNSPVEVISCIEWNNGGNNWGDLSQIKYSDIQDGAGGIGNITANPLFINAAQGNFKLCDISACRDAGDPDASYNDTDGTRNDMGYFGGPGGESYTYEPIELYPEEGLTAYYNFNGNSIDRSGNNNHGFDHNMAYTADRFGVEGGAAAFNGFSSYIEVPNNNGFSLIDSFSVTTWVRSHGPAGQRIFCNWHITGEGNQHYIFNLNNDNLRAFLNNQYQLNNPYNSPYLWHLVSFVYDNPVLRVYVDDRFVSLDTAYITEFMPTNTVPVIIGSGGTNLQMPQYVLNGAMDDLKVYQKALSENEISAIYNDYASVGTESVTAYAGLPFDIPVGTSGIDAEDNILSYHFDFTYDPTFLEYQGVELSGEIIQNGTLTGTLNSPGSLTVTYTGTEAIEGEGALVDIKFVSPHVCVSGYTLSNFVFNNGTLDTVPYNPAPDQHVSVNMPRTETCVSKMVTESLVIDGNAGEMAWGEANLMAMNQYAGDCYHSGIEASDLNAACKAMWKPGTDGGIYVYAEVTDDVPDIWQSGDNEWEKDNIEIYFHLPSGWGDPLKTEEGNYQDGTMQIRHNAMVAGHTSGKTGYNGGTIPEFDLIPYAFIQNDTGYTYEAFFPFATLMAYLGEEGITPENMMERARSIGFELQITDTDLPTDMTRCKLMWNDNLNADRAWTDTRYLGQMNLTHDLAMKETLPGEYVTDPNTVLLLHFNETEGSLAYDYSGYGNTAHVVSGTTIVDGRFGKARYYNGAGDHMEVYSTPELDITGPITLEAWLFDEGAGGWGAKYDGPLSWDMHQNAFFISRDGAENDALYFPMRTNEWVHLAATYDGQEQRVYINGELIASREWPGSIASSNSRISIGTHGDQWYRGMIDEVRISNKVRTTDEFNVIPAPTGFTARAVDNHVVLTWNAASPDNLHKYNIYRDSDPAVLTLFDSLVGAPPDTFYFDTGAEGGNVYHYHLSAVDNFGIESARAYARCLMPDTVTLLHKEGIITVDGSDEESLWQTADPVAVTHLVEGSADNADDLSASYKAYWDVDSIYFLIEVNDDSLYNGEAEPWQNDAVELYFDMNNSRAVNDGTITDWQNICDADDRQIRFVWEGGLSGQNAPFNVPYAFKTREDRHGYTLELAVSTLDLGFPYDGFFGFDLAIMDNDNSGGPEREAFIAWNSDATENWRDPSRNGVASLLDFDEVIPAEAIMVLSLPSSICGSGNDQVTVNLANYGIQTINEFDIIYALNQDTIDAETAYVTIDPGDTVQYTFSTPAGISVNGLYHLYVSTLIENGNPDANVSRVGDVYVFGQTSAFSGWKSYNTCNGLPNNFISHLMEDSDGNIWASTNGGVARKAAGSEDWTVFDTSNSILSCNSVTCTFEDHNGIIWAGLDEDVGIVATYDGSTWTSNNPDNIHVLCIFEDSQYNMWFGTWGHGVRKWDRITDTWTTYTPENSGLASNALFSNAIMEDADHNMWFATLGTDGYAAGLCKFDGSNWTVYNTGNSGIPTNTSWGARLDSKGNIWLAHGWADAWPGRGVTKFDGTSWTNYNTQNSGIHNDVIHNVFEDSEGNMWFGSQYNGLSKFDGTSWETFTRDNSGLTGQGLRAVTEDSEGNIWFSTDNGVCVYDQDTTPETHFTKVWEGNGVDQMNLYTLTAKIDGIDMEPGDEIAVFDGEYCVGMGVLTEVLNGTTTYLMFVASHNDAEFPAVNGFETGNEMIFRLWDASEQVEVTTVEATYTAGTGLFEPDGTAAFYLNGITSLDQSITLTTGWNIFSLAVDPEETGIPAILQSLVSAGRLIKVQDEAGRAYEYVFPIGWTNSIPDWSMTEGYKIKVNAPVTLVVTGAPISLPIDIPVSTGWNIIGYPAIEQQTTQGVLADLIASGHLIKVQDEAGMAIEYVFPIGWVDKIINFRPGEGYKVKVNTDDAITIDEPSSLKSTFSEKIEDVSPVHFRPVYEGYGLDHMNIYLTSAKLNGEPLETGDEIGLFDGDRCVGAGVVIYTGSSYLSLVASKDDPETGEADGFTAGNPIIIKIWSKRYATELRVDKASFLPGYGDAFEPLATTVASLEVIAGGLPGRDGWTTGLGNNYPNPFSVETTLEFTIGETSAVDISVYNLLGEKVKTLVHQTMESGAYKTIWDAADQRDARVPPGIYLCKMIAGNHVYVKSMEVIR